MKTPIIALALLMVVTSCGNADKNRQEAADPQNHKVMTLNIGDFKWTREPGSCTINGDTVTVVTKPHTDL